MQPESAKFLRDILDSGTAIENYLRSKSRDEFLASRSLRDAINWNFLIIGEALSQLHKCDPSRAEQITEWQRIISFRNQLIHGYGVIRNEITWDIIEKKLPLLLAEVKAMLAEA